MKERDQRQREREVRERQERQERRALQEYQEQQERGRLQRERDRIAKMKKKREDRERRERQEQERRQQQERERQGEERQRRQRAEETREFQPPDLPRRGRPHPPDAYRHLAQEIQKQYGDKTNWVRADAEISKAMLMEGYNVKEVIIAVDEHSPAAPVGDPKARLNHVIQNVADVVACLEVEVGREFDLETRLEPLKSPEREEKESPKKAVKPDRGPRMR